MTIAAARTASLDCANTCVCRGLTFRDCTTEPPMTGWTVDQDAVRDNFPFLATVLGLETTFYAPVEYREDMHAMSHLLSIAWGLGWISGPARPDMHHTADPNTMGHHAYTYRTPDGDTVRTNWMPDELLADNTDSDGRVLVLEDADAVIGFLTTAARLLDGATHVRRHAASAAA